MASSNKRYSPETLYIAYKGVLPDIRVVLRINPTLQYPWWAWLVFNKGVRSIWLMENAGFNGLANWGEDYKYVRPLKTTFSWYVTPYSNLKYATWSPDWKSSLNGVRNALIRHYSYSSPDMGFPSTEAPYPITWKWIAPWFFGRKRLSVMNLNIILYRLLIPKPEKIPSIQLYWKTIRRQWK